MASRVLVRFVPVLCRTSQAPAVTARLLPIVAAEVQRSRLSATAGEKLLAQTMIVKDDVSKLTSKHTQLGEQLFSVATPEDILRTWEDHSGNAQEAAFALKNWVHSMRKRNGPFERQPSAALTDPTLQNLLTTLSRQVNLLWHSSLVSTLQALWVMNLPPKDPVLTSVKTEVLWRIRKLSYKQLGSLVEWGLVGKDENMDIVKAALKQLELRWAEINDPSTISSLMIKGDYVSSTLLERLEDTALVHVESFSSNDIRTICASLAARSRRCVPLLKAFSYHLLQKTSSDFTTPLISDVAFAYAKLNFHNTELFKYMSSELLPRVPELKPCDVIKLAKSFAFLKWLNAPLFEAFAENYISNNEEYSLQELSNLVMTFARLGFQPCRGDKFYTKVHLSLENSLSTCEPSLQTNVAWALCVLQQARPQYLIPLLQEQHISSITDMPSTVGKGYCLKLLNIAASLQLEHPGSFDTEPAQRALAALSFEDPSPAVPPMRASMTEPLLTLVDGRKEALCTAVDTVYGWTIDGVIVMDDDNKAVDLSSFKTSDLLSQVGQAPFPQGTRRIAFLAWEFSSFSSRSKNLLGQFMMKKRHLQLAGFITVEVPHFEWRPLKTSSQRTSYLKDKIGKAVAEDMIK